MMIARLQFRKTFLRKVTFTGELASMSRPAAFVNTPDDFFSHYALDLTCRLLKNNHPDLAVAIGKTLRQLKPVPYEVIAGNHTGEMYYCSEICEALNVQTVGKIVSTLTDMGEKALSMHYFPPAHLNMLRGLIDDWVALTEWLLEHSATDQSAYH